MINQEECIMLIVTLDSKQTQNYNVKVQFPVKGRIANTGAGADAAARQVDERDKGVIFKNCAPFINCKRGINNAEIDNGQGIDIVMPMYNLIEYSENYSKTSGSLWEYYKDEPDNNLTDSKSFKSKTKMTGNSPNDGNTKVVEIIVPLKYLRNFQRINLILTQSSTCVITNSTGAARFEITDAKLYVPVITLSTQGNAKLLQQLKSGFKRTINWNKYQSDPKTYAQNQYLNHLVDPSFQGVNRLFVLSFENENGRTSHSEYYLPKVEIKDCNVKIDGKNFFDQAINYVNTHENFRKLLLVMKIIIKPVSYYIILTLKKITK